MANEYLKRTHTSSGNYKVATFSLWMKGQEIGSTQQKPIYFYDGATLFQVLFERSSGTNPGSLIVYSSSTDLRFGGAYRDVSSWMNLIVNVDTTKSEADRISVYLNGSKLDLVGSQNSSTPNYPSENAELLSSVQTINALSGQGSYEVFDYFYVDGQALTPDVFGYYKKGDGYISAGSTQATDFKKGQWVPKAPKVIRSVINARGGFGVNGFYLPMNDDSNFGADFHCEPNSIIKLKGEDFNEYPQPRNGAPTTTDAYVSELRTDPYAANLVLAVPGISTATGPNLITNGNFESNISGWTASGVQFTHTYNSVGGNTSGKLMYFATGTNTTRNIYQNITTETGKRYTLTFDASSDTASANSVQIDATDVVTVTDNNNTALVHHNVSFTATSTSTQIRIISTLSNRSYFDNFVVRQEDAPKDYSADIKGSGTNKTLTANGNAGVGYEIPSYYGSALSFDGYAGTDFYVTPSDFNDVDFGTGDFTVECWIKLSSSGSGGSILSGPGPTNGSFLFTIEPDNTIRIGSTVIAFRQNSSPFTVNNTDWNHIAFSRENGIGKIFCNGVCVSTASNAYDYDLSPDNNYFVIGSRQQTSGNESPGYTPFDGNIQDVRVYKGIAKYTSGFDVPKPYTPVGIGTWRAVPDCTANNFATLNGTSIPSKYTVSEGNLRFTNSTTNWTGFLEGTVGFSTGKWYWETRADVDTDYHHIGIVGVGITHFNTSNSYFYGMSYQTDGRFWSEGNVGGAFGTGKTQANDGDIVQVAVDMNDKKMWVGINGNWIDSGNPIAGTEENFDSTRGFNYQHYVPFYDSYGSSGLSINFGQNPTFGGKITAGTNTDDNGRGLFSYDVPTGFLALCEDNLPTPAIKNPGEHFKTVLWTGDGNVGRNITGLGFKPDFVWIKERSSNSGNALFDSVRGAANYLSSNSTGAEVTYTDTLTSFNNDGFSIANSGALNANGDTYVAWCWRAGAGTTTANTDGSINSVVSVNQDAGFSIVSYTGNATESTVGHGLNKTPGFIIVKKRNGTADWPVYHQSLATQEYLVLNLTNGKNTTTELFYQDPTSSVFYIGDASNAINASGGTYIAYCWTEIEGFSKFGSYVGNGNADGPFVYCGFKPAFVLLKPTSISDNWLIVDNARSSTNVNETWLYPNSSAIEGVQNGLDFLSNGFKLRNSNGGRNGNGTIYAFAAFAESPFTTANAK
jgi:hypothetical protein